MNRLPEIFDNAAFAEHPGPRATLQKSSDSNYFVAFTPRSGSSWLTGLLTSTKCLGRPEEWFSPDNLPGILKNFPKCDLRGYVDMARRRFKTPNGVFGFEASFFQIRQVEEIASLENLFGPDLIYVYLTRRDFVSQAVSLYRAVETGYFHSVQRVNDDVANKIESLKYDGEKVAFWCAHILQQEHGFERMFSRKKRVPLRMTYEELAENPVASVRHIAEHVDVASAVSWGDVEGSHRKIADAANQAWAQEFRDDYQDFVRYWEVHRGTVTPGGRPDSRLKQA